MRLQGVPQPGNRLAAIGLSIVISGPLLTCCITFALIPLGDKGYDAERANQQAQLESAGVVLGSLCMVLTPLIATSGVLTIILLRSRLDSEFIRKNTIHAEYALAHAADARWSWL
jgi:hypothetical protein